MSDTAVKEREELSDKHSDDLNPANRQSRSNGVNPDNQLAGDSSESDGWNEDSSGHDKTDPKSKIKKTDDDISQKEANASESDGNETAEDDGERTIRQSIKNATAESKSNFSGILKKRFAVGGAVGLMLATAAIVMFLPGIFMKVITERITDTFMGRVNYAVEQRVDKMLSHYVLNNIGGTTNNCTGTITKDCVNLDKNDRSIFAKVATNWKQNRLETKLFEKHGIEFQKSPLNDGLVKVIQNGEDLGDFGPNALTKKVSKLIQADSRSEGYLTRMQMRSVAKSKYGAKRFCFSICERRDAITTSTLSRVQKLKLKLVSEVSRFRSDRVTSYMLCKMASCNAGELLASDNEAIQRILSKVDTEILEEVLGDFEKYQTKSISQMLIQKTISKIVGKIVGETAGQAAASSVPVAGQVYGVLVLAELFASLDDAIEGKELSNLSAKINEQEAILYYTSLQSIMEEVGSGQSSVQDNWAAYDMMSGAGGSRLLGSLNGNEKLPSLKCGDDVVISANDARLVCPELTVKHSFLIEDIRQDPLVSKLLDITNTYEDCVFPKPCVSVRSVVRPTLGFINGAVGFVGEGVMSTVKEGLSFVGLGSFFDTAQEFFESNIALGMEWVTKKVVPVAINPDAEDADAVDQYAMGADALSNSFGKGEYSGAEAPSLGFKKLTSQEQVSLDTKIAKQKKEDMKTKSFFARYFDVNDIDSLASKATYQTALLLNTPSETVHSLPSMPFNTVANLFKVNQASASLSVPRENLFGISQYGPDESLLDINPTLLTPEKCEEYRQARINSAFQNESTGQTEYALADPCETDTVVMESLTVIPNFIANGPEDTNSQTTNTGASAEYIPDCSVNEGNAALACTAIDQLLGIPYSREQRAAPTTPDPVPFLDCSAFTGMAVFRTFGVNLNGLSSTYYRSDPNFTNLADIRDIKPGDFIGKGDIPTGAGGTGHIGIVVSYDPTTKKLVTVETDGKNNPSRVVTTKSLLVDGLGGTYTWAVRYIGPKNGVPPSI